MALRRFARDLVLFGLAVSASLMATARDPNVPPAGTISGRVTSSATGLGLAETVIKFYEETADAIVYSTTVDPSGNYSLNVPPGNYAVVTDNNQGHINEIYNNVQCSAVCIVNNITMLTVASNSFSTIDFVLDAGGRIAGTVTDSSTGLPIENVTVEFYDPGLSLRFTRGVTNAAGQFVTEGGTDAGQVYAVTENSLGYRNETFDNVACNACDPPAAGATAISVANTGITGGVNFALNPAGRISGTVTDHNGAPLAHVAVNVVDATFTNTDIVETDAAGHYSTGGLPAGTYYAQTINAFGYADQAWNGVFCSSGFCNPPFVGTPIPVTIGGNAANIDFALVPGGRFSGTVTNANGGAPIPLNAGNNGVSISNSLGAVVLVMPTDSNGFYLTPNLPPGTYYAQTVNATGFGNQLYNTIPCSGCSVTTGTPVAVSAGNTASNINLSLSAAGSITGTVTNASNAAPLNLVPVQIFSSVGTSLGSRAASLSPAPRWT